MTEPVNPLGFAKYEGLMEERARVLAYLSAYADRVTDETVEYHVRRVAVHVRDELHWKETGGA